MPVCISRTATSVSGTIRAPGDKSISHRALMLGAVAVGETRISGLLESADVMRTADALAAMGVGLRPPDESAKTRVWRVRGRGVGGLRRPSRVLDMGNSGTGLRLLAGLVASHPFTTVFSGDESLSARPMDRIAEPLRRMGAAVETGGDGSLPLTVAGTAAALPIEYTVPVPSAQVKSAILLAALNAPGRTTVIEAVDTRDHTERLLKLFGAEITISRAAGGGRAITLRGQPEFKGRSLNVPGDPSSAAFPVAALLACGSGKLTVDELCINPLRTGFYDSIAEMGAQLRFGKRRRRCGEPVTDLTVEAAELRGVTIPAERAPAMIDDYPALAAVAACARGTTVMEGLAELRVKESDRLNAICSGLGACGVAARIEGDSLIIEGAGGPPKGGARVPTHRDHRIAMAFLALGAGTREPVEIDDDAMIATSFPDFAGLMNGIGCNIGEAGA